MKSIPARLWALSFFAAVLQVVPFPIAGSVPEIRRVFCWICLAPLVLAILSRDRHANQLSPLRAALLAYLCGFVWYVGNCYWIYQTMHIYGGIPEVPSAGILFLFALYLGLYHAAFGGIVAFLHKHLSLSMTLVTVPFVWVAVELARARITGFPWDLLGYTQVDNFALTLLAPLGGVMLLSFLIAAVNVLFVATFLARQRKRFAGFAALSVTAVVALQLGVFYRPAVDPVTSKATLLQENIAVGAEFREMAPTTMEQKYQQFKVLSLHPVQPAGTADLIIWPEAPADFITSDTEFQSQVSGLAKIAHAPVITGAIGIDFDRAAQDGYREFGSAAVFDRDGSYLGRYDKIHRVPWGEYVPFKQFFFFAGKLVANVGNMQPGNSYKTFDLNGHHVGIFICYESIFGDEVREFTRAGADLLVNISDDGWYGDSGAPWQHLDMARMRAIENRRWILRDTNTGITTSIDPHGRGNFALPRHVRTAFNLAFGYRNDLTFYTRHGDWFAWLCAVVTAGAMTISYYRASYY